MAILIFLTFCCSPVLHLLVLGSTLTHPFILFAGDGQMVWITRPAGDWHPSPDDHAFRGLHSGGLATNLVCAEQRGYGASERNDVGEGRKWDGVKPLVRLGTSWDARRSKMGPDYMALRAQGWLLEKRRAGKHGRFMDEQGGYKCGQVSFAEVSRRESPESSGP